MAYIPPPKSSDCVWRSGPPPEIGWWPASVNDPPNPSILRFWGGEFWSIGVEHSSDCDYAQYAGNLQGLPSDYVSAIRWTDRWWEAK